MNEGQDSPVESIAGVCDSDDDVVSLRQDEDDGTSSLIWKNFKWDRRDQVSKRDGASLIFHRLCPLPDGTTFGESWFPEHREFLWRGTPQSLRDALACCGYPRQIYGHRGFVHWWLP